MPEIIARIVVFRLERAIIRKPEKSNRGRAKMMLSKGDGDLNRVNHAAALALGATGPRSTGIGIKSGSASRSL
jgi:hypothetical protein